MRGKQKLYHNLRATEKAKRRRNELLPIRNRALACRYYYYLFILRYQYEDTLRALTREFYIAESTIVKILQEDDILQIIENHIENKPDIKDFQNDYPQWLWRALTHPR